MTDQSRTAVKEKITWTRAIIERKLKKQNPNWFLRERYRQSLGIESSIEDKKQRSFSFIFLCEIKNRTLIIIIFVLLTGFIFFIFFWWRIRSREEEKRGGGEPVDGATRGRGERIFTRREGIKYKNRESEG